MSFSPRRADRKPHPGRRSRRPDRLAHRIDAARRASVGAGHGRRSPEAGRNRSAPGHRCPDRRRDPKWGRQALRIAASNGRANSVRHLLTRGADPGHVDPEHGLTALQWFRRNRSNYTDDSRHADVGELLCPSAPDPNDLGGYRSRSPPTRPSHSPPERPIGDRLPRRPTSRRAHGRQFPVLAATRLGLVTAPLPAPRLPSSRPRRRAQSWSRWSRS